MALTYCPHPLIPTANRQTRSAPFKPGETIGEYLRRVGIDIPATQPVILRLNDRIIARPDWQTVCPRQGDIITIRSTVHGGGGGSNPLRIVLTIAVIVASFYFGPQLGATLLPGATAGVQAAVGSALITSAGMMAVNTIAPLPGPSMSRASGGGAKESPTYSINGGSNRARPFQPLPIVLGRHRMFPDLGAKPYTEFHGAEQILYQIFNFGLSDVTISDLRIGQTPITDFQNVTLQTSEADGELDLFPGNVDAIAGGQLIQADGWIERTGSENTTALAVEISGAIYYAGDNGIEARSVEILIQYRAVGATAWTNLAYAHSDQNATLPAPNVSNGIYGQMISRLVDQITPNPETGGNAIRITNGSTKPVRRTYKWRVAAGQYEVRVKRITPDSNSDRLTTDTYWTQLRCYQRDTVSYAGQKRMAMSIQASAQLQGIVDQLSAEVAASIPVWTGTAWEDRISSNPAWQFLWLARGKFDATGRRIIGAGLDDSRIDIDALKEWAVWCTQKGLTCNIIFDQTMMVGEQLAIVARCGRASMSRANGKLGVVWDAAAQPMVSVFGMNNIIRGTFSVEYVSGPLADEVVVSFINPDLDWQPDTVRATRPGITHPVSTAQIEFAGCADADMAGHEANLLAAAHEYRTRTITWESDFEGLTVTRGDVAGLSHDLTSWGKSGRLVGGSARVLRLDRTVTFAPGMNHYCMVRLPDGSFDIYDVEYSYGETDIITLATPLPQSPQNDPDHPPWDYTFAFDPKATPGKLVKITDVKPISDRRVRIRATDENDDYYLAEYDAFTYVRNTAGLRVPSLSDLEITEQLIKTGTGYLVIVTLTWDVRGQYGGAIVRAGAPNQQKEQVAQTTGRRAEFTTRPGGTLNIEVVGFNLQGKYGPQSKVETTYVVQGKTLAPPTPAMFLAARQPDGTRQFTWRIDNQPEDFMGVQIRYASGTATDWNVMTPMHSGFLLASPFETNQLAAGEYTFAIKSFDTSGLESINARFVTLTIGNPRIAGAVAYVDLVHNGWMGTKTQCHVDDSGALIANDQATWDTLPATWDQWTAWVQNPYSQMDYVHEIDIGAVALFVPNVTFDTYGTQSINEQHSNDGVVWSDWETVGPPVLARYIRIQLTVTGTFPRAHGGVILLSADPLTEDLDDIATASLTGAHRIGVGDIRLPITKAFAVIKRVDVVLQNVGAGWTFDLVDKNTTTGPRIRIYNASGVLADAIIDATIKGV